MSKVNKWQSYINKIILWAQTKGYNVNFHPNFEDEMDDSRKIININSRFKLEIQLYGLLHECGHLLIRNNKKLNQN